MSRVQGNVCCAARVSPGGATARSWCSGAIRPYGSRSSRSAPGIAGRQPLQAAHARLCTRLVQFEAGENRAEIGPNYRERTCVLSWNYPLVFARPPILQATLWRHWEVCQPLMRDESARVVFVARQGAVSDFISREFHLRLGRTSEWHPRHSKHCRPTIPIKAAAGRSRPRDDCRRRGLREDWGERRLRLGTGQINLPSMRSHSVIGKRMRRNKAERLPPPPYTRCDGAGRRRGCSGRRRGPYSARHGQRDPPSSRSLRRCRRTCSGSATSQPRRMRRLRFLVKSRVPRGPARGYGESSQCDWEARESLSGREGALVVRSPAARW